MSLDRIFPERYDAAVYLDYLVHVLGMTGSVMIWTGRQHLVLAMSSPPAPISDPVDYVFYESVYRKCLSWPQRALRSATHCKDGTRRRGFWYLDRFLRAIEYLVLAALIFWLYAPYFQ